MIKQRRRRTTEYEWNTRDAKNAVFVAVLLHHTSDDETENNLSIEVPVVVDFYFFTICMRHNLSGGEATRPVSGPLNSSRSGSIRGISLKDMLYSLC